MRVSLLSASGAPHLTAAPTKLLQGINGISLDAAYHRYIAGTDFSKSAAIILLSRPIRIYMLKELEIKDFALVERLRLPFTTGFNVLTGEAGAGKSIIMDALNIALGGRGGSGLIRPGAEKAVVEAVFAVTPAVSAWLREHELLDEESNEFTITREISKSSSRNRVNGISVNSGLLQELRQKLVTVHAQHEFRTLMSSQSQLELIDALGDEQHKKVLARVRTLYARRKEIQAQLDDMLISESERERRLDFSRFQLNELEEARLEDPGEDATIEQQRKVLASVSDIESLLSNAHSILRGDDDGRGATDMLQRAVVELEKAASLDPSLEDLARAVLDCAEQLEDHTREVRRYTESLDSDPETLSLLEDRAASLATIKRKYGPSLADAIGRLEELKVEISKLENAQASVDDLRNELMEIDRDLSKQASDLSAKRKKLSAKLAGQIHAELVELGMPKCRFEISLGSNTDESENGESLSIGPSGMDRSEFLIAPNPGQDLLPIARIASGGELSRIMLAVKKIFAKVDQVNTVIFDEIDTGLSGKVLQSMRDKLASLAQSHQILCITHQPILASVADNHIFVSKQQTASSTKVSAEILNEEGRLRAVAEMASGQGDQETSINFAKLLVTEARKVKASLPTVQ